MTYEAKKKTPTLFKDNIEFVYVPTVIGSGYEEAVAKLAIEDGVAYRAARKNMQIHSAIILKINDEFSGFFTFQVNHDAKEFCLLQSAMSLDTILANQSYGYSQTRNIKEKSYIKLIK